MGYVVWGLRLRVQGMGYVVWGLGYHRMCSLTIECVFLLQGMGYVVWGLGFVVY